MFCQRILEQILLKTPRLLYVKEINSDLFYYFGTESSLNTLLIKHKIKIHANQNINLAVNIDGLPTYKRTNSTFWPILCSLKSVSVLKGKVFLVTLFHGCDKLNPHEFLSDFINVFTYHPMEL